MSNIGIFTKDETGFNGTITTFALKAKAAIRPVRKTAEHAPDYRVYASGVEIGAAWSRTSEAKKPYLSVKLDDPSFASAIFCRLVTNGDSEQHQLIWSR